MKRIAVDTETGNYPGNRNLPFIATSTDQLLKSKLYYLDLTKDATSTKDIKALKKICESKNYRKIFHNAPYDITALRKLGINTIPPYDDTMIKATLVNENFETKRLKALAKIYLNDDCLEEKELSKIKAKVKRECKKQGIEFHYGLLPREQIVPYATKDTELTIKLDYFFTEPMKKYKKLYDFEMKLVPIIVEMQENGLLVDRRFVKRTINKYEKELKTVQKNMLNIVKSNNIKFNKNITRSKKLKNYKDRIKKYGKKHELKLISIADSKDDETKVNVLFEKKFNPSSTQNLEIVIEKLGILITERTDAGTAISTASKVLKKYKDEPFINNLLQYRFLAKQLGTYYKPLYEQYTTEEQPVAKFCFWQSGAKTGRFSAELIQTMPRPDESILTKHAKMVRRAFIPRENHTFVAIDYDQIEMRIFADYSGCKSLIDGINDGLDPHLSTAYTLFGKDKVDAAGGKDSDYRKKAKTINFGIIYGMGKKLLADSLEVPPLEANNILNEYYKKYPVREYTQALTSKLYKQGYLNLKLKSPLMDLERDYRVPRELSFKSANMLIQGTAAYLMKYGMLRAYNMVKKKKIKAKLLCTIHDELIWEVSNEENVLEIAKMLKEAMEDTVTFKVPIVAGTKISDKSWYDVKDVKF